MQRSQRKHNGNTVTAPNSALYRENPVPYRGRGSSLVVNGCCFMIRLSVALLLVAALGGCAGRRALEGSERMTVIQGMEAMPAPERKDLVAKDRPALMGPLDTIQVDVFNVPDLSRELQIDSSGRIAMPLVGTLDASGKTARELANDIEASLRGRYIRKPEVTVNIKSSVSQVVTIDGQVIEPGLYPVTNQMTLMRAVASAKGLSEYARQDDVVVLRTIDSRQYAGLYNIGAIRRGVYDDPPIYANDIIIVGDSPQRRLFRDLVSLSPLLAAPLLAIIQRR
jgi:polysaccharide biosynthesis/export protein